MVGEAIAGLSALKTAFDMAKGLKDISDATIRNAAVIELQEKILSAQETQSSLAQQVSDLEKEVARLKDWEADKKRYELTELGPGIVAFSIKETMRNGEPVHRICANCFSGGKKSYLQQHVRGAHVDVFQCNVCGERLTVDKDGDRGDYDPSPQNRRIS
jgi:hypothetical protein